LACTGCAPLLPGLTAAPPLMGWMAPLAAGAPPQPDDAPDDPAQRPTQAAYVELLGNGLLISANYEIIIDGLLTARIGGWCFSGEGMACPTVAPIMVGYLLGTGAHRVELGAGAVVVWNRLLQGWSVGQTATVAWRYQPRRAGLMWKVGWTPILALGPARNEEAPIWLGVASGYTW
jgi:hypothetical protein